MARFGNENGFDVFDDELGGGMGDWIRFTRREDAARYIAGETMIGEDGNIREAEAHEDVDGFVDTRVIIQKPPLFSAFNAPVAVTGAAPFELLPPNPARMSANVNYIGQGVLIVGTREGVLGLPPQGYGLANDQQLPMTTTGNVWAVLTGTAGNVGTVYVFSETIS